jgi:hypothetical protein
MVDPASFPHEATSPFKVVNFLELVGEAMDVEKPDLFKQWKICRTSTAF